jgi:hypothetical protein
MPVKVAASRLLSAQYYHGLTDHSTGGQSAGLGAVVRGLLPKQNKPPRMGLDAELRRRHGGCRRMLLPLLLLLLPLLRATEGLPAAPRRPTSLLSSALPELPPHPRLVALPADVTRLRASVSPEAAAAQAKLRAHGELLMTKGQGGAALRGGSLDLVYTMGVLHRLAQNGSEATQWSDFALANLMKVCESPDICNACCSAHGCNCTVNEENGGDGAGPRSASLCTGSLGQALAISYDWFYSAMTPAQRAVIRHTIVTQILNVYAEGLTVRALCNHNNALCTHARTHAR